MPRYIVVTYSTYSENEEETMSNSVNQTLAAAPAIGVPVAGPSTRPRVHAQPTPWNVGRIEALTQQILDKVADVRTAVEEAKQRALGLCTTRDDLQEAVTTLQALHEEVHELLACLTRRM